MCKILTFIRIRCNNFKVMWIFSENVEEFNPRRMWNGKETRDFYFSSFVKSFSSLSVSSRFTLHLYHVFTRFTTANPIVIIHESYVRTSRSRKGNEIALLVPHYFQKMSQMSHYLNHFKFLERVNVYVCGRSSGEVEWKWKRSSNKRTRLPTKSFHIFHSRNINSHARKMKIFVDFT